jgi:hypothetical protein
MTSIGLTNSRVPMSVGPVGGAETLALDEWQRSASQVFVPLSVDPREPSEFCGRLNGLATAEATAVRLEARPHQVERTPAHIRAGGSGYFKFSLQLDGCGLLVQDGRESTLLPGDITVYDTSRPYTLTYAQPATQLVLMIPHERFGAGAADVAELVATPLGVDGLADVVVPVLSGLANRMVSGRADLGAALVRHAVDLVETLCRDDAERLGSASILPPLDENPAAQRPRALHLGAIPVQTLRRLRHHGGCLDPVPADAASQGGTLSSRARGRLHRADRRGMRASGSRAFLPALPFHLRGLPDSPSPEGP